MYSYVVTSQKPTSVQHALQCNFTGPNDKNLILGKGNYLEVKTFNSETAELTVELEVPLNGAIASLNCFRPTSSNQDVLFILTEHKHICVIGYDSSTKKLVTRATGNCKDRIGRELECGVTAIVDPENRYICMMLYEGLMKMIQLDGPGIKDTFNVRSDVISVVDMVFLHGCQRPTLCVLYEGVSKIAGASQTGRYLKTYVINSRERELENTPWNKSGIDQTAYMLVPVPKPTGGLLVIGENAISYVNGPQDQQSVICQSATICAHGFLDGAGCRLLLGDAMGTLFVLVLEKNTNNVVTSISIDYVGQTSIPHTISYLGDGIVFIGSVYGDSKLLKLLPGASPSRDNCIEDLETFPGIGPILDMCVIDSEKQGQVGSSIVATCSGAGKDGSIRVMSSGIGINEQASIELPGINDMWSLRSDDTEQFDKYLVQSFTGETKILAITNEEMTEAEITGFHSDQSTLFCANMNGDVFIQVTPSAAVLVDSATFARLDEFVAPNTITVATANREQIILAVSGGQVIYLTVDELNHKFQYHTSVTLDQEVACVSIRPVRQTESREDFEADSVDRLAPKGATSIAAVGMWTDGSVRLLALPSLQELGKQNLGVDTQARDILLITLEEYTHAFVGLGDGTLISYLVDFTSGLPALSSRKRYSLGTSAVLFSTFLNVSTGALCVFISCDKPTILYTHRSKVLFSSVNIGEVTGMAAFHSELFPGSLALSTPSGLLIGSVDDIQKIHIQSFPLGESARRIAYHSTEAVFAGTLMNDVFALRL
jgi:DNA damage-binding protein 1